MSKRMRKKKNLGPRMEKCSAYLAAEPREFKGSWRETAGFPPACPLHLEIGCGKGKFICEMAALFPGTLFVAMDRVNEALITGLETAAAGNLSNLRFISGDAADLSGMFCENELNRIYLNFSDPWTPMKHRVRRLTHRSCLETYSKLLVPRGEVHFKTDNRAFYLFSKIEFAAAGFELIFASENLHSEDIFNVATEYEVKFAAQGMPIYKLEAVKK